MLQARPTRLLVHFSQMTAVVLLPFLHERTDAYRELLGDYACLGNFQLLPVAPLYETDQFDPNRRPHYAFDKRDPTGLLLIV